MTTVPITLDELRGLRDALDSARANMQNLFEVPYAEEMKRVGAVMSCRDEYSVACDEYVRAELGREAGEDARDAARYRWLRENCGKSGSGPHVGAQIIIYLGEDEKGRYGIAYTAPKQHVGLMALDAAIDAALSARGRSEGVGGE